MIGHDHAGRGFPPGQFALLGHAFDHGTKGALITPVFECHADRFGHAHSPSI
jgi:hypothetical protein